MGLKKHVDAINATEMLKGKAKASNSLEWQKAGLNSLIAAILTMGIVAKFITDLTKAVPVLVAKICTFLLLLFTLGMLLGYTIAAANISPAVFLIPVTAMVVMWYKLDEGMLLLIFLLLLVFLFPEILNSLFSAIL